MKPLAPTPESPPSLLALAKRIDAFLFAPADIRVCAWLRIGFGILVLINLGILALDFEYWFGETGVAPYGPSRHLVDSDASTLFTWLPKTGIGLAICSWVMVAQAICLVIGFFSRFQSACLFVWLASLQHRSFMVFDGEDVIFRLFAFFLIFLPIGACWSVDAWRRNKRSSLGRSREATKAAGSGWALRLIQVQLSLVYLSTVWLKLDGAEWLDGSALWYVFRLEDFFGRMPMPEMVTDSLAVMRLMGWAVIAVEAFLVVGFWFRETRMPSIALGVALHLGLELTMNLFLFEWIMMLLVTSHLRGEEIEAAVRWGRRRLARFGIAGGELKPPAVAAGSTAGGRTQSHAGRPSRQMADQDSRRSRRASSSARVKN